jgi:hypothetical protein
LNQLRSSRCPASEVKKQLRQHAFEVLEVDLARALRLGLFRGAVQRLCVLPSETANLSRTGARRANR